MTTHRQLASYRGTTRGARGVNRSYHRLTDTASMYIIGPCLVAGCVWRQVVGLAAGGSGVVYVCGTLDGSFSLGSITLATNGGTDIFVVRKKEEEPLCMPHNQPPEYGSWLGGAAAPLLACSGP